MCWCPLSFVPLPRWIFTLPRWPLDPLQPYFPLNFYFWVRPLDQEWSQSRKEFQSLGVSPPISWELKVRHDSLPPSKHWSQNRWMLVTNELCNRWHCAVDSYASLVALQDECWELFCLVLSGKETFFQWACVKWFWNWN